MNEFSLKQNNTIAWFVSLGYSKKEIIEQTGYPYEIVDEWINQFKAEINPLPKNKIYTKKEKPGKADCGKRSLVFCLNYRHLCTYCPLGYEKPKKWRAKKTQKKIS